MKRYWRTGNAEFNENRVIQAQKRYDSVDNIPCIGLLCRYAAKRKELDAAEKRIAELSNIFKRLYEDSVIGRISDERFMELSADYEAEQKKLKERAAELEKELAKTREATAADGRMHGNLRRQEIEIYYSFVGKVDLPE